MRWHKEGALPDQGSKVIADGEFFESRAGTKKLRKDMRYRSPQLRRWFAADDFGIPRSGRGW